MDYIKNIEKKCAICGHQHHYQKLVENNSFGMRDLDTRPPGMMRSLMHLMVEKCPVCGYANEDISKKLDHFQESEILNQTYQQILHDKKLNFALKKFMLISMLLETRDYKKAGISYLRASWMADDSKNFKVALQMRSKAIKYLELSLKVEDDENVRLIIVDLYRRISMFDEAFDYAKYLYDNFGMEKYKKNILSYQMQLCLAKDDLDHTILGNYHFSKGNEIKGDLDKHFSK